MPSKRHKVSLVYFIVLTLLIVGMVPLILTGWLLSDKSAVELRAVENRYQIQLVQEKARQIEVFGKSYGDLVTSISMALELSGDLDVLLSAKTEQKLGATLKENPSILAIAVNPMESAPVVVRRSGGINLNEIEQLADEVRSVASAQRLQIGSPRLVGSTGEMVMTFSSPVRLNDSTAAIVTAIVSLEDFGRNLVGIPPTSEAELWKSGLPIIFVLDDQGRALFHPDPQLVAEQRSLSNLKIVEEWQQSGRQVQSALVPFTVSIDGRSHNMVGAYSTVSFGAGATFGVFTMQDERNALASVSEMRTQTWMISLAFACFALLTGFFGTRFLSSPVLRLVHAAERVAGGDYSSRVDANNITEIGTLGQAFNLMTDKIQEQITNLERAATENRELFVGTVKALAAAIDGKDKYTRGHSERVARISVAIGRRLDLDEVELDKLKMSALLHDVGKIAIDDAILKKPAALTAEEFEIMKTHPQRGYKIMSQIPAMKDYLPGMYMHHEMVNGKGYPQGLKGDEIPLQARIVSVADTFDAMTIDRPYSKALPLDTALARISELVGTRYDERVVQALIEACREGDVANGVVRQRAQTTGYEPPGDDDLLELDLLDEPVSFEEATLRA